jgi:hypothetical protein
VLEGRFERGQLFGWARKVCFLPLSLLSLCPSDDCPMVGQKLPSGDCYSGYVSANSPEGYGEYQWMGGDHYEGQWRSNAIHGTGSFAVATRNQRPHEACAAGVFSLYRGQFSEGKPRGQGEYRFPALSATSAGMWTLSGSGWACISYDSGLRYEGECVASEKHGHGQLLFPLLEPEEAAGEEVEAAAAAAAAAMDMELLGDDEHGIEEVLMRFGGRLVGVFERDVLHGEALLLLANGHEQQLTFRQGKVLR